MSIIKYLAIIVTLSTLFTLLRNPFLADIAVYWLGNTIYRITLPGRRMIFAAMAPVRRWRRRRLELRLAQSLASDDSGLANAQEMLTASRIKVIDLEIATLTADDTIASLTRLAAAPQTIGNPEMVRRVTERIAGLEEMKATGPTILREAKAHLAALEAASSQLADHNHGLHAKAGLTLAIDSSVAAVEPGSTRFFDPTATMSAIDSALAEARSQAAL